MGGWSQELCGGTHVRSTGEVGSIRILSESAISAGTRRLEAVAGISAYEWVSNRVNDYHQVSQKMGCQPNELLQRVEQLSNKSKELEKKLRSIEQKSQAGIADSLIESAKVVDGIRIIHGFVPNLNPNDLRGLTAQINKRSEPSVVLLASEQGKKSSMVCICSPAAIEVGHKAGTYISELAEKIGGKGGGKADFAMGGGPAGKGLQQSISALSLNS